MTLSEREKCLKSLSATQFMLWELHLYLDTHPCDTNAMRRNRKYAEEYRAQLADFEAKFGPLSAGSGAGEDWLKTPWPWETEECVK